MAIGIVKPKDEVGAAWPAICVGMFVAFGGVLFGYDTVRTASSNPLLQTGTNLVGSQRS